MDNRAKNRRKKVCKMAKIKKRKAENQRAVHSSGVSVSIYILSGGAQHLDGKLRKTEKSALH